MVTLAMDSKLCNQELALAPLHIWTWFSDKLRLFIDMHEMQLVVFCPSASCLTIL